MSAARAALAALALLLGVAVPAWSQHHLRIDPAAAGIRDHRLTDDAVAKVSRVMHALDAYRAPSPEAPRPDVALITVLGMSFAYNEPLRDTTVDDHVRAMSGHPALLEAVAAAGLTPREYVLTWITLLLSYPVAAASRPGGQARVTSDVAPANVAFVQARAADVETLMREFAARVRRARAGG